MPSEEHYCYKIHTLLTKRSSCKRVLLNIPTAAADLTSFFLSTFWSEEQCFDLVLTEIQLPNVYKIIINLFCSFCYVCLSVEKQGTNRQYIGVAHTTQIVAYHWCKCDGINSYCRSISIMLVTPTSCPWSLSIPHESTKPEVFWCFQGV